MTLDFDPLNRNSYATDPTNSEKTISSFGASNALIGRETNNELETFAFNQIGVLKEITTSQKEKVNLTYNSLNQLANIKTPSRDSDFNYDSYRRIGEYDKNTDEWKYYHWCLTRFYGYEDKNGKYFIVPDALGSTVVIIDENSGIVNRLGYDVLGNLKNQTTSPQVELLFRKRFLESTMNLYIDRRWLYDTGTGDEIVPVLVGAAGTGSEGGGSCIDDRHCRDDEWCIDNICRSNEELGVIEITATRCGAITTQQRNAVYIAGAVIVAGIVTFVTGGIGLAGVIAAGEGSLLLGGLSMGAGAVSTAGGVLQAQNAAADIECDS